MASNAFRFNSVSSVTSVAILGLMLVFFGCKKAETPEERAAKETKVAEPRYDNTLEGEEGMKNAIRGYTKVVIDANMKWGLIADIRNYATEVEGSRVNVFIEERRKENAVMRSRLDDLRFGEVSIDADTAFILTQERWLYDYVDLDGKLVQPLTEMTYHIRYTLVRPEGKWLVAKIEEERPPMVRRIEPPRALFEK